MARMFEDFLQEEIATLYYILLRFALILQVSQLTFSSVIHRRSIRRNW
jgi:hypothetical protein